MNIGTQCPGVVKNAKFLSNLMRIDHVSLTLGYYYVDTWYLLGVRFHPNLRVSWRCWQERAVKCLFRVNTPMFELICPLEVIICGM